MKLDFKEVQHLLYWNELIEIAQDRRQQEIQDLENQHNLHDFNFTSQVPEHRNVWQAGISTDSTRRRNLQNQSNSRSKWAQQDLRRMLLLPNPNTKFKEKD